jgi:hypothetical protein
MDRDDNHLWTLPRPLAEDCDAADEESRFGDWRTPKAFPPDLPRRTGKQIGNAKGIIVGVHDRQP